MPEQARLELGRKLLRSFVSTSSESHRYDKCHRHSTCEGCNPSQGTDMIALGIRSGSNLSMVYTSLTHASLDKTSLGALLTSSISSAPAASTTHRRKVGILNKPGFD